MFEEGEPVSGIYFIVSGKVKVHKRWGADKELIVRIAGDGEIVGHRGVGKKPIYPVSATTLEAVTACFIDLDFFQASLKVNADYALKLLLFLASELQESENKMRNLAHMQVKGRIATALLNLKDQFGIDVNGSLSFQLSRQDLASFAGTTYETAFRILNELAADGIIEVAGKDIAILSKQALIKCIEET